MFRLLASTYFLFGMLLSVTNHTGTHHWIVYMTSLNYLLIAIYFIYGVIISFYAVFFRKRYYKNVRGTLTRKNNHVLTSKENVIMTILSGEEEMSPPPNSNVSTSNGSKVDLMENRYSVDAIIYGIEENYNRTSLPNGNLHHNVLENKEYRHARLHDNQLPKITLETVTESEDNELGTFFKMYWLSSCLTFNLTALTVIIYWFMMYRYQDVSVNGIKWFLRVDRHAVVLIFITIDHMITRIPIRILHFIYPSLLFLMYGFINALYTIITKDYVYEMLNFNENTVTSIVYVVGASFVATPLMQFIIYWAVYRVRERVFGSL